MSEQAIWPALATGLFEQQAGVVGYSLAEQSRNFWARQLGLPSGKFDLKLVAFIRFYLPGKQ